MKENYFAISCPQSSGNEFFYRQQERFPFISSSLKYMILQNNFLSLNNVLKMKCQCILIFLDIDYTIIKILITND